MVLFQPGFAEIEFASVLTVFGGHAAHGTQFHVFQGSGHVGKMIVVGVEWGGRHNMVLRSYMERWIS